MLTICTEVVLVYQGYYLYNLLTTFIILFAGNTYGHMAQQ